MEGAVVQLWKVRVALQIVDAVQVMCLARNGNIFVMVNARILRKTNYDLVTWPGSIILLSILSLRNFPKKKNHALWKAQVRAAVRRARIDGHLTGESVALEKDFIDKEAKKTPQTRRLRGGMQKTSWSLSSCSPRRAGISWHKLSAQRQRPKSGEPSKICSCHILEQEL